MVLPSTAGAQKFCDHGPARQFITIDAHALFGGSAISQNYMGCFPEIREIDSNMGISYGGGFGAEFNIRDYLALGTQINFLINTNRVNLAVSNFNVTSVSNVFVHNRYYYVNVPVYMSFKFNLAPHLRWNIDGGFYYSYGVGGRQRQNVYTSSVNQLGQLINHVTSTRTDYFNNQGTFINRFLRGDLGLYAATGLTIKRHYHLGVRAAVGFKNVSTVEPSGITNPNIHNFNLQMVVGYKF